MVLAAGAGGIQGPASGVQVKASMGQRPGGTRRGPPAGTPTASPGAVWRAVPHPDEGMEEWRNGGIDEWMD